MTKAFETLFNVDMKCQSCVDCINDALSQLKGLDSLKVDLQGGTVAAIGVTPPSEIVKAINLCGKDAVIRGSGKPNSAAVCILESFNPDEKFHPVKGLARLVEVSDDVVVVDLTVNGLPKGIYYPQVRTSGVLSQGAMSTGSLYRSLEPITVDQPSDISLRINSIGAFTSVSQNLFSAQSFFQFRVKVQDLIGRSIVLSTVRDEVTNDSVCGVIARSAGAWENEKEVCSCTGKTVWQERNDALNRGITS